MLIVFCLGFVISGIRRRQVAEYDLPSRAVTVMRVDSEPRLSKRTVQFESTLIRVADSLGKISFEDPMPKVIVSVAIDKYSDTLRLGDYIIATSQIYKVENNNNPFEFDYREYLRRRGICNRAYVLNYTKGESDLISTDKSLIDRAKVLQLKLVEEIDSLFVDDNHAALVSSLLIGYREELSSDLRGTFGDVGLSHILAVSGLHIGFVYMIMIVVFFPLLVNRFRRFGYVMIILSLWIYAFISGMSPSVVRATIMISILVVGRLFYLPYNSRNALFSTAIIMLCYNPMYIYDVGFQLSFMAVWSIIIFYSKVRSIVDKCIGKLPLVNRLTSVISLSLSAQILALPLSLYYFNIVPIWFLLANILVVPILPIIIGLSALSVLFGVLGIKFELLISVITLLIDFVIGVGEELASWSSVKSVSISLTVLLICYFMIFAWIVYMNKPKMKILTNVILFCSFGLGVIAVFGRERPVNEIVIFNHYKKNNIHLFFNGHHREINLWGGDIAEMDYYKEYAREYYNQMRKDLTQTDYYKGYVRKYYNETRRYVPEITYPKKYVRKDYNEIRRDVSQTDYSNIGYFKHYGYEYNSITVNGNLVELRKPFVRVENHRFCVLLDNDITKRHRSKSSIGVDYLLVGDSVRTSLYDLHKLIDFDTVVILPSLRAYQRENYIEQLDSLQVPYFDIKKEGAFRLPLN